MIARPAPNPFHDDLDFFANSSNVFGFTLKKIKSLLAKDFDLEVAIEAKDFSRFSVATKEKPIDFKKLRDNTRKKVAPQIVEENK